MKLDEAYTTGSSSHPSSGAGSQDGIDSRRSEQYFPPNANPAPSDSPEGKKTFSVQLTHTVIQLIRTMTGISYDKYLSSGDARKRIADDLQQRVTAQFPEGQTFSLEIALAVLRSEISDHIARLFGRRVALEANKGAVHVEQSEVDAVVAQEITKVIAQRGARLAKVAVGKDDAAA